MPMKLPPYPVAQKAICGAANPIAFLHLGIMYAEGIGIASNQVLAHYFIQKALDMGCKEAEVYVNNEYEAGKKCAVKEIMEALDDEHSITQEKTAKARRKAEVERKAKNYGNLSEIHHYLPQLYPEYNREKAMDDILNSRDTLDADIFYATSTEDNTSEIFVEKQDLLLQQLYAPFEKYNIDSDDTDGDLLGTDESELAQCLVNYTETYDIVCQRYHVDRKDIFTLETLRLFPYVSIKDLALLRQQGLRCLLSVKDINPVISEKYLNSLRDDRALLDICAEIRDVDLQLFLISFVELNIDINALQITSLQLLKAYRSNQLYVLVDHLNAVVKRLTDYGVKHDLPTYTTDNLPPIDL